MYFNDGYVNVYWSPLPVPFAALLSFLLLTTKYVTIFDASTRGVIHTVYVGPFALIPITSSFPFTEINSIEVRAARHNRFGHMNLVLQNGDKKIILIDGDQSSINGTYWRIKEEITKHINLIN